MSAPRVFFYVQHLLGIGHFRRAAAVAREMARAGLEVSLASGGPPVAGVALEGVRLVQLPPLQAADAGFRSLVDAAGKPVDEAWKARRRAALLAAWADSNARVLVVELYPFGRRQMRFELVPLLEAAAAARPRPVIVCSVRDILQQRADGGAREDAALDTFDRYFDHLMVHGDETVVEFGRTFRHADRLGARLHYTGYVTEAPPAGRNGSTPGAGEVLVSAGGGIVGRPLLEAAIRASAATCLAHRTWRVLGGLNLPDADLDALARMAAAVEGTRVEVERSRPEFAAMLGHCALSISQGGYNTVTEILHAGAAAVVVPWRGGGETEQALRARLLAERGWFEVLDEAALSPQSLAAAVDRAAARSPRPRRTVRLDGARRSAALVRAWALGASG